jgi:hypothetical protein
MKKAVAIAVLGAVLAVPALACDKPSAPASMPDGKTASKDEMLAAKKEVDAFKQSMDEYLSCEKNSMKAENAQAELMKVADRFNLQIRAFKARG